MATYALIHGAGSDSWYWHLVVPELRARGHDVVAPDLPCDDDTAGFSEYADVVVEAIGDRTDLVVVAQSLAGFTAPLVCTRVPVALLILVAAMVPVPGESPGDWWANTGWEQARRRQAERRGRPTDGDFDPVVEFFHDVPPEVVTQAFARGNGSSRGRRSRSRGRSRRGRTCRRGFSCVVTTASSRPSSCGASCRSAWASRPTRWTAATCQR